MKRLKSEIIRLCIFFFYINIIKFQLLPFWSSLKRTNDFGENMGMCKINEITLKSYSCEKRDVSLAAAASSEGSAEDWWDWWDWSSPQSRLRKKIKSWTFEELQGFRLLPLLFAFSPFYRIWSRICPRPLFFFLQRGELSESTSASDPSAARLPLASPQPILNSSFSARIQNCQIS